MVSNIVMCKFPALFDVAQQGHASHHPVLGSDVTLEVDGSDIVELSPARLPVYRTLVQLAVLPWRGYKSVRIENNLDQKSLTDLLWC